MNPELQKCREQYETLLHASKRTPTAKALLTAIEIAESLAKLLEESLPMLDNGSAEADEGTLVPRIKDALARISKPEGE